MLRRAWEAARVLPLTLKQADNSVDLAANAIVGDDRLLALVQNLDLLCSVLDTMIIAA